MNRRILSASLVAEAAQPQIADFHKDYLDEVISAVTNHDVVVVGMGQNPVVSRARKALTAAGINHAYVAHGNYLKGYRRRLAVKIWSGFPTFPQVFVKGVLIGGAAETVKAIADGSMVARIQAPRPAA
jgi:monothiol glutaredoxin